MRRHLYELRSIVHSLGVAGEPTSPHPTPRRRERLPTTNAGFLQREAEIDAPKAILRQLRRSPTPPDSPEPELEVNEEQSGHQRRPSLSSLASSPSIKSFGSSLIQRRQDTRPNSAWKEPQPFEVLRAVERRDLLYLMEIRDRSFHVCLLVRMSGGITPLLHANAPRAFSRWVNHLEDDQMDNPRTKMVLKALRTNLKLAIDYGLTKTQGSDLTASFLQTLIMSQGDTWVLGQAANVGLALRAGTEGQPVKTAGSAVRKFATRELGKADLIATLADYIANATADLLMMGAWTMAAETLEVDRIPTYYFARDDRVYKAFAERLDAHKTAIQFKLTKRLKWQLRNKVELLAGELDEGEGV
ncbi:hypothetical protein C8R46DRAFT_1159886 [Mycena filopes]|nr:hypothetical protein C8R46DRAFT_1159886 [Mycena filopes]